MHAKGRWLSTGLMHEQTGRDGKSVLEGERKASSLASGLNGPIGIPQLGG